jgi:vacuolar-type H+-ATPase subunit D/Vma8
MQKEAVEQISEESILTIQSEYNNIVEKLDTLLSTLSSAWLNAKSSQDKDAWMKKIDSTLEERTRVTGFYLKTLSETSRLIEAIEHSKLPTRRKNKKEKL